MTTRHLDTGTDELLCDVTDHVATITLNRPAKRNALGDVLTPALREALLTTEADPEVRVLVITGAGEAFCAGGDISGMGDNVGAGDGPKPSVDDMVRRLQHAQETVTLRLHDFAKPTLAALPGPAAGAGMSIALACDMRIAADTASLVPAFGRIGLSGDFGGSWLLSRLIGPGRAKEVYFTGRRIDAQEGQALGVFNRVVPFADLRRDTTAFAASIAAGAPIALRYMKENHNRAQVLDLKSTMAMEADRMIRALHTDDNKAAVEAFFAKRPAEFRGRGGRKGPSTGEPADR